MGDAVIYRCPEKGCNFTTTNVKGFLAHANAHLTEER